MLFYSQEKVFSLSRTADAPAPSDISALFSEFYCYLLVAGLYREGEGIEGVHISLTNISHENFLLPSGAYNAKLGELISKGLRNRFLALMAHRDLSDHERGIIQNFDGIFTPDRAWYKGLTGRDILSVAYSRNFSDSMRTVARYVSVAFGQSNFAPSMKVPRLYLSIFGNIHLTDQKLSGNANSVTDTVFIETPLAIYGSKGPGGDVTALWAILSSMIDTLSSKERYPISEPGNYLGDMLASLAFIIEHNHTEASVPAPSFAQALYVKELMGIGDNNLIAVSAMFYSEFLYGTIDTVKLSRAALLNSILDLMMKKTGDERLSHLFTSNSFYRKLTTSDTIYGKAPKRPKILQFALEALDPSLKEDDEDLADTSNPTTKGADTSALSTTNDGTPPDPFVVDGGYDPSTPPPATPVAAPDTDKDTIGLISFDKSGEGVDEDLYRAAVVALNKRLRSDDTLPVSAETRNILNYWVNGWLYRTAISATKDQIKQLNLQMHLKIFSI